MPPSMKGTPKPIVPGSASDWCNEPLERFNKFSSSPVSAWEVRDGTLGTFTSPIKAHQHFAHGMRDLGEHGQTNTNHDGKTPTWKTAVLPDMPLYRVPKRHRLGIAGGELGPAFVQ
mmetsp:Transcript_50840/g.132156  ORF Transcript_50840/g.132156 Transcript_50840/m.132156 type:complete len:116 (-) Transcript_50840:363-710(-)